MTQNKYKKPKLAWSQAVLDFLPPVYVQMIHKEHERAVERYHARIKWDREKAKEKAKKASCKR